MSYVCLCWPALFHGWAFGPSQEVNHSLALARLLVFGKEPELHSWVSSISKFQPICEKQHSELRAAAQVYFYIWYFGTEQMVVVAWVWLTGTEAQPGFF